MTAFKIHTPTNFINNNNQSNTKKNNFKSVSPVVSQIHVGLDITGTGFFYVSDDDTLYFVTAAEHVIINATQADNIKIGSLRNNIYVKNKDDWVHINNNDIVYDNMSDIALIRLDKNVFKNHTSAIISTEKDYLNNGDENCFSVDPKNNTAIDGQIKNKKYYDPTSEIMICESILTTINIKGPVFIDNLTTPLVIGMISYDVPQNVSAGLNYSAGPNCIEMMKCINGLINQFKVRDVKKDKDKHLYSMNTERSNHIGLKCRVAKATDLDLYSENKNKGIIVEDVKDPSGGGSPYALYNFEKGDLLLGFEYKDNNGKINKYVFGTSSGQVMPGVFLYMSLNTIQPHIITYKQLKDPTKTLTKTIYLYPYGQWDAHKNNYAYKYLHGSI